MPIKRPIDTVAIYAANSDHKNNVGNVVAFDRFTSLEITNDLTAPAEACFEVGDDGTWESLGDLIQPGAVFLVVHNGRNRLVGRVEANDVPIDAAGGATVRFVVRTKMADAMYASAAPNLSVRNGTLKDVILRAYAPLKFTEDDFVFETNVARDLMTGEHSSGGSSRQHEPSVTLAQVNAQRAQGPFPQPPLDQFSFDIIYAPRAFVRTAEDLAPMTLEQAKVNPPETIFEFVERHLNRFRMTHWDSPDGKIVVGAPNDFQKPIYKFICKRGTAGRENNILSATYHRDISDAPTFLSVTGVGGKTDFAHAKLVSTSPGTGVDANKFYRPVFLIDESIRSRLQAQSRMIHELTARSKKLDGWTITVDGWSYWDGQRSIPYGIDTVAEVQIDVAAATASNYLIHRVRLRRDADNGDTAELSMVKTGLWRL